VSLRILACFAELTTLSITTPIGFDLDDITMAQLAAAWPNMVDLSLLIMEMDTQSSISMTLESLRALVHNCRKLESLQISLDATSIPEPGAAPVVQNQLKFFGAGHSSILSATPVARYLSGLFPRLLDITTDREEQNNNHPDEIAHHSTAIAFHRLWKEVEDQILDIALARDEERA